MNIGSDVQASTCLHTLPWQPAPASIHAPQPHGSDRCLRFTFSVQGSRHHKLHRPCTAVHVRLNVHSSVELRSCFDCVALEFDARPNTSAASAQSLARGSDTVKTAQGAVSKRKVRTSGGKLNAHAVWQCVYIHWGLGRGHRAPWAASSDVHVT